MIDTYDCAYNFGNFVAFKISIAAKGQFTEVVALICKAYNIIVSKSQFQEKVYNTIDPSLFSLYH